MTMFTPIPPRPNDDDSIPRSGVSPSLEQDLRAFVGPNADYYLRQWHSRLSGQHASAGFNKAAFFLSGFWVGYRKMYKIAFFFFGIILAEMVLEELLFVGVLKMPESPAVMTPLVGLVVGIVFGICGNGWYLSHAQRVIAKVQSQQLEGVAHSRALAGRGGTSLGISLGLFFLFLVAVFVVAFVLELVLRPVNA